MTIRITKTRNFLVDAKRATKHSLLPPVPSDRPLNQKRLDFLRQEIVDGRFHSCEWAIAKCLEDGVTYRPNGKHTSVLFSDPTLEYGNINITYTIWECDTREELARIYASYDQSISNRSLSDINKAVAAYVPSLEKAAVKTINDCVAGIACAKYGVEFHRYQSTVDRAQGLNTENDFCAFVREVMESKDITFTRKMFRKYGIIAAMWLTYYEDAELARIFWQRVFNGEGNIRTPERVLNTYIITTPIKAIKAGNNRERSEILTQKCLRKWDAWTKERRKSLPTTTRKRLISKRKKLRSARISTVAKKNA